MSIDIVHTLTQPQIALVALLWGAVTGALCALIKLPYFSKSRIATILTDILSSTLFGVSYIGSCLYNSLGVIWVYTLLSFSLGWLISYLISKKLIKLFLSSIKKLSILLRSLDKEA